ncbi:MAG: hypothetical protein NZ929_04675 [Aigarchaeota archaeon]|nr:hypothetical protein [Aigarchaeota archaeon]MCX8193563.1 hypothetical protein [Nitrososphaeria archaeon]MDW7986703.1 hypothetical protein [Nitrososphaerota archaeon]
MKLVKIIVFAVFLSIIVYSIPATLTTHILRTLTGEFEATPALRATESRKDLEGNITAQATTLPEEDYQVKKELEYIEYIRGFLYHLILSVAVASTFFIVLRRIYF